MFFRILECASRAERSSFDGVPNPNAVVRPILQEVFYFTWLIREAKDDFADPPAAHEIDLIEKERRIGDRHNGLRCIDGQRPETRPFTTSENESFHRASLIPKN